MSGKTRIVTCFLVTVTVLVLLFGYRTSTGAGTASVPAVSEPATTTTAETTVTGPAVETSRGTVQVSIGVTDGRIVSVDVDYPTENSRAQEINGDAVPVLVEETLEAQSADVDMVTGATATSEGYVQSLQAAIDEAGLAA